MSNLGGSIRSAASSRQLRLSLRPAHDPAAPTFAEFFAGIGLVRLGLERAGWRVALANDIDEKKRRIYDGHFGDAAEHFVLKDIRKLQPADIPTVELATASFPCTDLSLAGARRGIHRGESSTFWAFVEILERLGRRRPPLVLLENVTGFLTSHAGDDFRRAMQALNALGYAVDPFILDARWFTPQSRPRLFVVGRQADGADQITPLPPGEGRGVGGAEEIPVSNLLPSRIRPQKLLDCIAAIGSDVCWSIRPLSEPPEQSTKTLVDILESIPHENPIWWSDERAAYLFGQMSPRHRAEAETMIARRAWSYATIFRRVRRQPDGSKRSMAELRTDGLAGCLRTPKGGSGRQILWKAGYGKYHARLLTPAECARLMGADGYETTCSLNDALFGFGDAVCSPAVAWIAEHYLNPVVRDMASRCVSTAEMPPG